MKTKKWYQKTIWIIVLLVLFSPAGLYLMWRYTNWNKGVRWVISAILGIYILFYLMILIVTIADPTVLDTKVAKVETTEKIKIEPKKEATISADEKTAKEAEAKKAEEQAKKEAAKKLADTVTVENTIVKKNSSGFFGTHSYWFSIGHNIKSPSGKVKIELIDSNGAVLENGEYDLKDISTGQFTAKAITTPYEPDKLQIFKYKYAVTINGFSFKYKTSPITDKFSDESDL